MQFIHTIILKFQHLVRYYIIEMLFYSILTKGYVHVHFFILSIYEFLGYYQKVNNFIHLVYKLRIVHTSNNDI